MSKFELGVSKLSVMPYFLMFLTQRCHFICVRLFFCWCMMMDDGSFCECSSLGISGSLVSKLKLGVSTLSKILYVFYVFDSKMSFVDVLPLFFLIMYDDG